MRHLAIIPARGGSKRLPRKNVLPLGGKPLVRHTIDAATQSGVFSKIILSSDDDEILSTAADLPEVTCEKRESTLAGDLVKVIDLVKSIAQRPGYREQFQTISLLLPTCPFRTAKDMADGFKLLTEEYYSVVSVAPVGEAPQLMVGQNAESGELILNALVDPSPLVTGATRSQDFMPYFRVNGGFYTAWINQFVERNNFFEGRVRGYVMEASRSVDVDHEQDLEVARFLYDKGYIFKS